MEENEETKNQTIIQEDIIRLNKTSTGKFAFEIKLCGRDHDKMLKEIDEIYNKLNERYKIK